VPTAIKVYNWVLTLWRGDIHLTVPMLFAIGFIFTFINGGLTGCFSATCRWTYRCPPRYFVVAHFHLVMGVSPILVVFGALYHWYPKMTGKKCWTTPWAGSTSGSHSFGTYMIYLPMYYLGILGLPRRYYAWDQAIQFIPPVGSYDEQVDHGIRSVRRRRAIGVLVQPGLVILQGQARGQQPLAGHDARMANTRYAARAW